MTKSKFRQHISNAHWAVKVIRPLSCVTMAVALPFAAFEVMAAVNAMIYRSQNKNGLYTYGPTASDIMEAGVISLGVAVLYFTAFTVSAGLWAACHLIEAQTVFLRQQEPQIE